LVPTINIILLFPELGDKYDVVEFKAEDARRLILEKKVCYASPFDLEYYGKKKEASLTTRSMTNIYTMLTFYIFLPHSRN
jgi:hypothetical protein